MSLVLKARSFISEGEPQNLVDLIGDNLETISTKAFQTLKETCFTEVFENLEALDDEKDVCRLRDPLFKYHSQLIVVGFNSGKYDLNVINPISHNDS